MAYSKSPAVARKELPNLNRLLGGGIVVWEHPPGGADKLAYRLRQARWIILRTPQGFGQLPEVVSKYRFEATEHQVRAIPTDTGYTNGGAVTSEVPWKAEYTIISPATIEQVIQKWLSYQPSNATLRIHLCDFTNTEIAQLEEWAAAMSWKVRQVGEQELLLEPQG